MKAKLSRKVTVEEYTLFAELDINMPRPDIQKFLLNRLDSQDSLDLKVKMYLSEIGLISNQSQLTQRGNQVLDSGKLDIREMGGYKVQMIVHDPAIGMKLISIKRETLNFPEKDPQLQQLPVANPQGNTTREESVFLISRDGNREAFMSAKRGVTLLNFGRDERVKGFSEGKKKKLTLTWEVNSDSSQKLRLEGNLETSGAAIDTGQLKIEHFFTGDVIQLIRSITGNPENENLSWNSSIGRMQIPFEQTASDQMRESFQGSFSVATSEFEYGEFDQARLEDIPLMPASDVDAQKWRDWLLDQRISQEFVTPRAFVVAQESICQDTPIRNFDLHPTQAEAYLDQRFTKKKESDAFWNLATTIDLNPFGKSERPMDPLHFSPGEKIQVSELASALTNGEPLKSVIYIDRYTNKQGQQELLSALASCFQISPEGTMAVISLHDNSRSDYLTQNNPEIIPIDYKPIGKLDHDRYWLFERSNGELLVWNCTRSLDFLQLGSGKDSSGLEGKVIEGAVSFVPIDPSLELFSELLQREVNKLLGRNKS